MPHHPRGRAAPCFAPLTEELSLKKGSRARAAIAMSGKQADPRYRAIPKGPREGLRIRTVTVADRDEWIRLRRELWRHSRVDLLEREVDIFISSHTAGRFRRNGMAATVIVAELGRGKLVGFAEADLRPFADGCRSSPVGYLEGWYVAPELRRTGIGRALVGAAEDWARDLGCHEMASDAEVANASSQLAHKALGYSEVHRLVHFRRDLPAAKLKRAT